MAYFTPPSRSAPGCDCISLSETERHGPSEEEGWLLLARMLGACTSNGERIKQLTSWCICDKEGGKERALSFVPAAFPLRQPPGDHRLGKQRRK